MTIIERRTRRPVLGVVPYAGDLVLPEEDSVALGRKRRWPAAWEADWRPQDRGGAAAPHLQLHRLRSPGAGARGRLSATWTTGMSLTGLDLLILPGTKNTISDLLYLKETGLFRRIQAYVRGGGRLVGICGGYQILGQEVRDPLGVEGAPRTEAGLGLLPVVTTMAGAKTTTQVEARRLEALGPGRRTRCRPTRSTWGRPSAQGQGQPRLRHCRAATAGRPGWPTAGSAPTAESAGTYLHGVFENDAFRRRFSAITCTDPRRGTSRAGDVMSLPEVSRGPTRPAGRRYAATPGHHSAQGPDPPMTTNHSLPDGTPPHGGDVYLLARALGVRVADLLDFSANINPLGYPAGLPGAIAGGPPRSRATTRTAAARTSAGTWPAATILPPTKSWWETAPPNSFSW